jgi:hypothetical protein
MNGINLRRFWDEIGEKSGLLDRIRLLSSGGCAFTGFSVYLPQKIGVERCFFESYSTKKDRIEMQLSLFKVRLS